MKITIPEGMEAPTCERCGSELEYQGSSAIWPPMFGPGSNENKEDLGNGRVRTTPVGYEDHFRCIPCLPPHVKVRRICAT